jgi:hypothetical protein
MQIHEIFQKKRVNEATLGGAVQGVKTAGGVLGAIASGVAGQLKSAASQKVLGIDVFDKTDKALGPEAEQRARTMSKSMIKTQAATNHRRRIELCLPTTDICDNYINITSKSA